MIQGNNYNLLNNLLDTILDGSLILLILAVWNLEDATALLKAFTTLLVSIFTVIRWVWFVRDRKRNKKENENTK